MFEDNLLSLFHYCPNCGEETSDITKQTVGTCIHITQKCSHCLQVKEWYSQPFVKSNMPAGNILLSAAILFSGALPTQILRVLKAFGCESIDSHTFFDHQRHFLHPSIASIWREHQAKYLKELRKEKRGLILGGDGRADSPGHSAKFGSYTTMELKKKVVLDIQLVQVCIHFVNCLANCVSNLFLFIRVTRSKVATTWN